MRRFSSPILCALVAGVFAGNLSFAQTNSIHRLDKAYVPFSIRSGIEVSITPDTATLTSSEKLAFTAMFKNTSDVAVKWTSSTGTISSTGVFEAPKVSEETVVIVKAISVVDHTKFAQASVVVKPAAASPAHALTSTTAQAGSSTIKQSFFGADFHGFGTWPPTDGEHQIATLGGIRLWDSGVKWAQVEPQNGVYNWTEMDNWMAKAQAQHLAVLYTIGDTPSWAGKVPPGSPCGPSGPSSCASPKDINSDGSGADAYFSDFISAVVKRYKGQISYYELWNEPDCTCFWSGSTAQIVRMGKDAASIIRSNDPSAKILSPSAHGPTMATWFDQYVVAGGAANFDIVNAHLRGQGSTNGSPEAFLQMYNDVVAEVQKRNLTSKPIWDDEHGIKSGELSGTDNLAGYVARSLLLRAGVGLQQQYIYTWDGNAGFALQGSESGTAWDVVAGWLVGHSINACTASGTVYTCNLDNGQAVWDTAQHCNGSSCSTSSYKYPSGYSHQTDITGTTTGLGGSTVPIGYKPILLTK